MIVSSIREVLEQIDKLDLSNSKFRYAVFDFDNTCIVNDIGEATLAFLCENKLLRDDSLLPDKDFSNSSEYHRAVFRHYFHMLDENKIEEAYRFIWECLSGFSVEEINNMVERVVHFEGEVLTKRKLLGLTVHKGLTARNGIAELFTYTKKKDIEIWIVSASSDYIVRQAFEIFFPNVKARCIGTENIIKNNVITSNIVYPLCALERKVDYIQSRIHKSIKPIFAVGDSINDKAMLEYAELTIVIDRGNSLSEYAKKQDGWVVFRG